MKRAQVPLVKIAKLYQPNKFNDDFHIWKIRFMEYSGSDATVHPVNAPYTL